jgi:hypothetical protein
VNKRQAKKAFKKKYGVNPAQMAKILNKANITEVAEQAVDAIRRFCERLPDLLDEMVKSLRAAVAQINTEQIQEYLRQLQEEQAKTEAGIKEIKEGETWRQ